MKDKRFFCKNCNRFFDDPNYYDEKHGLDNPPYERIPICSNCGSDNFLQFDCAVLKNDVAEKMLPAIMHLNRYINSIKDVFGVNVKNYDLDCGVEFLNETLIELFDFLDIDMQKRILNLESERELNRIFTYLKGEL